ncbi:MAG TPA: hypothetical protein VHO71_00235 [Caproiciproducens sp.]|nr:hypothetical protein [Caproiciproducens sp.]
MQSRKHTVWLIWTIVVVFSYLLLFIGVKQILHKAILPSNIMAYLVIGIVFGSIASGLLLLKWNIIFWSFILGLLTGYSQMYYTFMNIRNGWEDLSGLLGLFVWAGAGLGIGTLFQLGWYIFKQYKKRNEVLFKK